jgi:hypothetical protein
VTRGTKSIYSFWFNLEIGKLVLKKMRLQELTFSSTFPKEGSLRTSG